MAASENRAGIFLMVAAMAGFALEDMFVKLAARDMPVGQILTIMGAIGAPVFALIARLQGARLITPALWSRPVLLRNGGELVGTFGYISAVALTPLATASAILQALPLVVTMGAALFLGAKVGWRRWSAILAGFLGVLIVLRPGAGDFEPASLLAVLGVAGLALRDLATRTVPRETSSMVLSAYGFAMTVPLGLAMLALGPAPVAVGTQGALWLTGALAMGLGGYWAIVEAMRLGEIAVVTPFRYARLLFALILGALVFAEYPDAWTLTGAALIIASGLYTFTRERALSRRAAAM
ncbi:MAG: DMT family transporter [Pseudomonadota bacterium]